MERPVNEGVYEWSRPKRVGQVVRHWKTSRHGLVVAVDDDGRRMNVRFPDTLGVETRWQKAFYEMDVIGDPEQASAIFPNGTHQGIWWPDFYHGAWYLMAEGRCAGRGDREAPPQAPEGHQAHVSHC